MSDVIQSTPTSLFTGLGHHHHHESTDTQRILESVGNSAMHMLNAGGITNKAISDTASVTQKAVGDTITAVVADNAAVKNQITSLVDTIHTDGNETRGDVKAEGRNLDNKIADAERAAAAASAQSNALTASNFHQVSAAIAESKFASATQSADLARYLGDKFAALGLQVAYEGSKGRELLLSENLAELRSKACCCAGPGKH